MSSHSSDLAAAQASSASQVPESVTIGTAATSAPATGTGTVATASTSGNAHALGSSGK